MAARSKDSWEIAFCCSFGAADLVCPLVGWWWLPQAAPSICVRGLVSKNWDGGQWMMVPVLFLDNVDVKKRFKLS